jgi:hypothetical protein
LTPTDIPFRGGEEYFQYVYTPLYQRIARERENRFLKRRRRESIHGFGPKYRATEVA